MITFREIAECLIPVNGIISKPLPKFCVLLPRDQEDPVEGTRNDSWEPRGDAGAGGCMLAVLL